MRTGCSEGRRRLCERVDTGRPICHVAADAGIARQTLDKWYSRWLAEGDGGPVTISELLAAEGVHVPASTVHRVPIRRGTSRPRDLDVSDEEPA